MMAWSNSARERAHEVIAGYFCGNDVSVRDWQLRAQTFQIGRSFDTHGPIGPYLVTPDEVGTRTRWRIERWSMARSVSIRIRSI